MRITKWAEYGVHCSIYIAGKDSSTDPLVSAQEIADSQGIPIDYVRQILQRLKDGNVVKTIRGPQGGYLLARPPTEITLADILTATEGDTFQVICATKPLSHERCSEEGGCNLKPIWYALHDHIESFLKGYTLQKIIDTGVLSTNGLSKDAPIQINAREVRSE